MSLISCDNAPHPHYCPPIVRADQQTKNWFKQADTPDYVIDYLDRIGKQQKAIEELCN